jgi:hypothetical protein
MNMSNVRHWKVSLLGAVIATAMLATACDPYLGANTAKPVVLGVMVIAGTPQNRNWNFPMSAIGEPAVCPGGLRYPPASGTWFAATYPQGKGNCGDGTTTLVACPEDCWPPRSGPAYAPYFLGDTSGSYGCAIPGDPRCSGGNYSYATSASYSVADVPPGTVDDPNVALLLRFNRFWIQFNKSMDGSTIQNLPAGATQGRDCVAAAGITVTRQLPTDAAPVDITALMNVCYIPSSSNVSWGSAMSAQYKFTGTSNTTAPALEANTTFVVAGTVKDQQGNSLPVSATFVTGPDYVAPVPAAR